ncbi:MAG: hypothetical protein V4857_23135 [Pseudomonadota bacterium]
MGRAAQLRTAGLLAVLLAAGAGVGWYLSGLGDAQRKAAAAAAAPALPAGARTDPPLQARPAETTRAYLARLTATARPADAFKAFSIELACSRVRAQRSKNNETATIDLVEQRCGDMTDLQVGEGEKNLQIALVADVPGAVQAALAFGPQGDINALLTRPSDPAVVAWKHRMHGFLVASANQHCDLDSIDSLVLFSEQGTLGEKNPSLALTYQLAKYELVGKSADGRHPRWITGSEQLVERLSEGLTPEQVAAAALAGKQIATQCSAGKDLKL